MKKVGVIACVMMYLASMIASGLLFGIKAIAFNIVACCATSLAVGLIADEEPEDEEPEHDSCEGCKNNLGGGHCKINLEDECCEGGGFEMWEE